MKQIGCVMTNQSRKEWGVAFAIAAGLAERLKGDVHFWFHVDRQVNAWSLPALVSDFQLGELVHITEPPVDDQWLAQQYRSCDLTILPSLGEGFGYPIVESLACGTPCLHVDYAGGASVLRGCEREDYLIPSESYRLDGQHDCLRPVIDPQPWITQAMWLLAHPCERSCVAESVEHLAWPKLWPVWRRWFMEGLA